MSNKPTSLPGTKKSQKEAPSALQDLTGHSMHRADVSSTTKTVISDDSNPAQRDSLDNFVGPNAILFPPKGQKISSWSRSRIIKNLSPYREGETFRLVDFLYGFENIRCRIEVLVSFGSSFDTIDRDRVKSFSDDLKHLFEDAYQRLPNTPRLTSWNDFGSSEFQSIELAGRTKVLDHTFTTWHTIQRHFDEQSRRTSLPSIPSNHAKYLQTVGADACDVVSNFAIEQSESVPHTDEVTADAALVTSILDEWRSDTSLSNDTVLTQSVQKKLAEQAAAIAKQTLAKESAATSSIDDKVVDPVSGLELPLPPRKPYQERGRRDDGTRLNVFEHLRAEYPEYFEAGLMFSGLIRDVDRAAYQALLKLAKKHVNETEHRVDQPQAIANYLLSQGILTATHLSKTIPLGFESQVDLLKQLHKQRIATGLSK